MNDLPVFGQRFWIDNVKRHERRDGFEAGLTELFQKHGELPPDELAGIVVMVARKFYSDCDINDVYDFSEAIRREFRIQELEASE